MRDYLVGYLLDALEPAEQAMVEAELVRNPRLKEELDLMSRSLEPLSADKTHHDPPLGLAHRTCEYVTRQARAALAPAPAAFVPSRWSLTDMVVAAGIFFAAALLFLPAVNQSRFAARVVGCQNNLRQIGMGLRSYSTMYSGIFPVVNVDDGETTPGIYAHALREHGLLKSSHAVVCPDSPEAERGELKFPTSIELRTAHGRVRIHLLAKAGGSYGYTLGYISRGRSQPTKNLERATFALVADSPGNVAPYHSKNHGGCGQNVLFEDLHVQYLTTCRAHGCGDDIYTNDEGQVAPGLHAHDSVIGPSILLIRSKRPVLQPAQ